MGLFKKKKQGGLEKTVEAEQAAPASQGEKMYNAVALAIFLGGIFLLASSSHSMTGLAVSNGIMPVLTGSSTALAIAYFLTIVYYAGRKK